MSLHCDIVQDLIALYHDGLASPTTQKAVAEHLRHCRKCRKEYQDYRTLCSHTVPFHSVPSEQSVEEDFPLLAARIRKKRMLTMAGMTTYVCISCFVWIFVLSKLWCRQND